MNLILIDTNELAMARLSITDERAVHMLNILKTMVGQNVKMGVINHSIGIATLTAITSSYISFNYTALQPVDQPYPVTLVVGASRPLVMKRLLRDCTAIGCQHLAIYTADNGEKSYLQSSLWHNDNYLKAIIEGLALAKSVAMPSISTHPSLADALTLPCTGAKIALHVDSSSNFKLLGQEKPKSITLVVGNERGLTLAELDALQQNNYTLVTMGKRIVRTETACVMALALAINLLA